MALLSKIPWTSTSIMARNVPKALTGAPATPIIGTKLHFHRIFNAKMNQWPRTMCILKSYQHFSCVRLVNINCNLFLLDNDWMNIGLHVYKI